MKMTDARMGDADFGWGRGDDDGRWRRDDRRDD